MATRVYRFALVASVLLIADQRMPADDPIPTDASIRKHLLPTDAGEVNQYLVSLGSRAFPAYERILNDPACKPHEIAAIFSILKDVPADRSRFVGRAVQGLADASELVRWPAVMLLGEIGSRNDVSPLVAEMVSDDIMVVGAAAEALAKIGGPSELLAMDVWLAASSSAKRDRTYRSVVQKHREALARKLENAAKAAPKK
ncbi:MAG: HEAT repeat domain-containing protein [Gemmataceae bacterium]